MSYFKKFPSLEFIFINAYLTAKRFPLALAFTILGTIIAMNIIDSGEIQHESLKIKLLMISAMGLPLFLSITVVSEIRKLSNSRYSIISGFGILLLAAYYISLPGDITKITMYAVRFLLLNIGLHFLTSFIPFIGRSNVDEFWQYNKTLFLRFLTAALYSSVMFLGLLIALAAADHLFGMEVKEVRYGQLWVFMAGIFNIWIFLAGIPKPTDGKLAADGYPKGLKLFTQYIFLPLVILYFVILISYEAKIFITWDWPKGWVSHLVLWYSVVGILSLLLLHPLKEGEGTRWIKIFSRWFFWGMIPLVVMLYLAIFKRIAEYGITENRYFVLVMAIGLSVLTIYFIFSRKKDIRAIPIILFCLTFYSAYGPWNAFSVSLNSQTGRINRILSDNNIQIKDNMENIENSLSFDDKKELSSIINYLVVWHGTDPFAKWFSESSLGAIDTVKSYDKSEKITELFGFNYIESYRGEIDGDKRHFRFLATDDRLMEISDYDYAINIDNNYSKEFSKEFQIKKSSLILNLHFDKGELEILFEQDSISIKFSLKSLADTLYANNYAANIPADKMIITKIKGALKLKLCLDEFTGYYDEENNIAIISLKGSLFIAQ